MKNLKKIFDLLFLIFCFVFFVAVCIKILIFRMPFSWGVIFSVLLSLLGVIFAWLTYSRKTSSLDDIWTQRPFKKWDIVESVCVVIVGGIGLLMGTLPRFETHSNILIVSGAIVVLMGVSKIWLDVKKKP